MKHTEVKKFKGVNTVVMTVKTVIFAPCPSVCLAFFVDASLLASAAFAVCFDVSSVRDDAAALCVAALSADFDASTACLDVSSVFFEASALRVAACILSSAAALLSVAAFVLSAAASATRVSWSRIALSRAFAVSFNIRLSTYAHQLVAVTQVEIVVG